MTEQWQPANPVETALQEALARGDQARFCAVLAESLLLVPVEKTDGDGGRALVPTRLDDGANAVPVYTSPEALSQSSVQGSTVSHTPVGFSELALGWPDPSWLLAVNPGLPVAAYLVGAELPGVVATVFAPVNEAEQQLAEAGSPPEVLGVLSEAELYLPVPPEVAADPPRVADPEFPWYCEESGAEGVPPVVPVFTSPERLRGCLGLRQPEVGWVSTELPVLALAWPDPGWALAVNPGAPTGVTLLGAQVERLAQQVSGALTANLLLQVLVPAALVAAYLDQGYATAAGVVHVAPAEPVPLPELYRELGLLRAGSPFSESDGSAYLLRWQPEREVRVQWAADPTPRSESVTLPAGAELVELRADGEERLIATFAPEHGWTPADPPDYPGDPSDLPWDAG